MAQEAGHTAGMAHSSRAHGETAGGSGLVRWPGDLPVSVATGADGPTVSWDVQDGIGYRVSLSIDGQAWFPVAGTDGVNVVYGTVADVDIGLTAPVAAIATPSDGALLTPGIFDASAMGVVLNNDTTYTWLIDGEPLVKGQSVKLPLIETGVHSIELLAENAVSSESMLIEVSVGDDDDLDGLPDDWELANGLDPTDQPGFVHGPTGVLATRVLAGSGPGAQGETKSAIPAAAVAAALTMALIVAGWFVLRRRGGISTS